uniref:hypothetical protein n=1 Tax=Francisella sp. SYW-9 TaxID=2610888 RepID=UPI00168CF7DD
MRTYDLSAKWKQGKAIKGTMKKDVFAKDWFIKTEKEVENVNMTTVQKGIITKEVPTVAPSPGVNCNTSFG